MRWNGALTFQQSSQVKVGVLGEDSSELRERDDTENLKVQVIELSSQLFSGTSVQRRRKK